MKLLIVLLLSTQVVFGEPHWKSNQKTFTATGSDFYVQQGLEYPRKATEQELRRELHNPEANREELLQYASRSQLQVSPALLSRRPFTPEQIGWLARTKPWLLSRTPREPVDLWMRAESLARPEQLLPKLFRKDPALGEAALDVLEATQPDGGVRCMRGGLKLAWPDPLRGKMVAQIYNLGSAEDRRWVAAYASHQSALVQSELVELLLRCQPEGREVLSWLARPATQKQVLERLGNADDYMGLEIPESREPLKQMLLANQGEPHLVMQALRQQYRINLGDDAQAWKDWLNSRWPGEQRLSRLPRTQLTGLLAAGWLGTLKPEDLRGVPRRIQVPEIPHDDVIYPLEVSVDGHFLSFGSYWAYHLPTQTVIYPHDGCARLVTLPQDRYLTVDDSLQVRVRSIQGKVLASWTAEQLPRDLHIAADGRLIRCDDQLRDPMTGAIAKETPEPEATYSLELVPGKLLIMDLHDGSTRELKVPGNPEQPFLTSNGEIRLCYPESVAGYRASDLQPLPAWPLRMEDRFESSVPPLLVFGSCRPDVRVIDSALLSAPPEHQRLLTELWTGYRLQSGVPVELLPAEMDQRCRKWQELGGGNWNTAPQSLPGPGLDLSLPLSLGAVGLLLILLRINEGPR